jgi:hypothetical protein
LVRALERLAVNAKVATVLGSIPASSDTVESEGRHMKQSWIVYIKKKKILKNSPLEILRLGLLILMYLLTLPQES